MNDPIVEEIRKYRSEHARKFDYNINAICSDYKLKHNKYVNMLKQIKSIPTKKSTLQNANAF